jgi:DNA-binding LytR/AlgR family response regulator
MSLKSLESILRQDKFMRIHRSFIIAVGEIQAIDRNHVVLSDGKRIAIAEQYKVTFFDFIN